MIMRFEEVAVSDGISPDPFNANQHLGRISGEYSGLGQIGFLPAKCFNQRGAVT
jgi:hypothetical protein